MPDIAVRGALFAVAWWRSGFLVCVCVVFFRLYFLDTISYRNRDCYQSLSGQWCTRNLKPGASMKRVASVPPMSNLFFFSLPHPHPHQSCCGVNRSQLWTAAVSLKSHLVQTWSKGIYIVTAYSNRINAINYLQTEQNHWTYVCFATQELSSGIST